MITIKDNAPVKFLEEDETPFDELNSDCNCLGQDFCQIVHSGDNTPFQVGVSEATGNDLVTNGAFSVDASWTKGSGWTIGLNRASHSGGGGELSQTVSGLRASTYYKLIFSVSSYSNSQTMLVSLTGDVVKTINTNGTYTVYWFTDSTLTNKILKFTPHTSTTLNIDDVQLYEMSTVVYGIKDLNDQVVKTVSNGTGVTYYQTTASIEVDWSDVEEGCYRLFLIDNSNNLFTPGDDGTFEDTSDPGGTPPSDWSISIGTGASTLQRSSNFAHSGTYSLISPLAASFSTGVTTLWETSGGIAVQANSDYIIEGYVLNGGSAAAYEGARIYFLPTTAGTTSNAGGIDSNVYVLSSTTGVWNYVRVLFNSGDNTSIDIKAIINFRSAKTGGGSIYIDDVTIRGPIETESECFTLGEFSCTKLLSWSNNENAYGHTFEGTVFQHELRVNSKLWKPKYPKDRKEVFVDSVGHRTILTSRTKKEQILTIQHLPEYLHDALSIGVEHDNFYIDGEKYINEENDYSPSWRSSSLTAPVEVTVVKDNQDLSNSYC
jgi:hypothetical protein